MTERAARRVLSLAQAGVAEPSAFRMFAFGGVIQKLSPETFDSWIEFLVAVNSRIAADAALDLYHLYYAWKGAPAELPEDLTFRLLTASPLFKRGPISTRSAPTMTSIGPRLRALSWSATRTDSWTSQASCLATSARTHTIIGRFNSATREIISVRSTRPYR